MKLAMAQMRMGPTIAENLEQTLQYMEKAKAAGADLIFFINEPKGRPGRAAP